MTMREIMNKSMDVNEDLVGEFILYALNQSTHYPNYKQLAATVLLNAYCSDPKTEHKSLEELHDELFDVFSQYVLASLAMMSEAEARDSACKCAQYLHNKNVERRLEVDPVYFSAADLGLVEDALDYVIKLIEAQPDIDHHVFPASSSNVLDDQAFYAGILKQLRQSLDMADSCATDNILVKLR